MVLNIEWEKYFSWRTIPKKKVFLNKHLLIKEKKKRQWWLVGASKSSQCNQLWGQYVHECFLLIAPLFRKLDESMILATYAGMKEGSGRVSLLEQWPWQGCRWGGRVGMGGSKESWSVSKLYLDMSATKMAFLEYIGGLESCHINFHFNLWRCLKTLIRFFVRLSLKLKIVFFQLLFL